MHGGSLCESGVTLVELMISMTVGMFVVLAATAVLVSVKSGYLEQDDEAQIQETGRYALDVIGRSVRQASHDSWDVSDGLLHDVSVLGADVFGLDARTLKGRAPGIEAAVTKSVNGSDVLAIRFFGSGVPESGDGTMLNCAGFSAAAPSLNDISDDRRAWSIFYVATDATGEPELYCKYRGDSDWTSQAIARGVESFQVLYGLDTDMDGLPDRMLNASAIQALDDTLELHGASAVERAADKNKKTHWKKVVAVRVAMLIRGTHDTRARWEGASYTLFGDMYANAFAASDPGVRIKTADLPAADRGRARRIFATTIRLRNGAAGMPA
jgi:type IV pilus assembly protein PilW